MRRPEPARSYDSALLVAEGARRATSGGLGVRRLVEALAGVPLDRPRGMLVVDGATSTAGGPLRVRQVKPTRFGPANFDVAELQPVGSLPTPVALLAEGTVAGYLNEYLCA
jgi:hypothetical protein